MLAYLRLLCLRAIRRSFFMCSFETLPIAISVAAKGRFREARRLWRNHSFPFASRPLDRVIFSLRSRAHEPETRVSCSSRLLSEGGMFMSATSPVRMSTSERWRMWPGGAHGARLVAAGLALPFTRYRPSSSHSRLTCDFGEPQVEALEVLQVHLADIPYRRWAEQRRGNKEGEAYM